MSYYDDIYEEAIDSYGVITTSRAKRIGVPKGELVKLAKRGRIDRIGYGVYRIKPYVPTRLDRYADAVALVGEGSYIFGESVLAIHELAFVNPRAIMVATPKRTRRTLPAWVEVIERRGDLKNPSRRALLLCGNCPQPSPSSTIDPIKRR